MERVTQRDIDDAETFGKSSGLNLMDEWSALRHEIAQLIADGRRAHGIRPHPYGEDTLRARAFDGRR